VSSAVTDTSGNPLAAADWSFRTGAAETTIVDTTAADFAAGAGSSTYVGESGDGELQLAPEVGAEFSGSALPDGWSSVPWMAGGGATVGGGTLTVDGTRVAAGGPVGPGRSLEFAATFTGARFQHVGFA